MKLREKDHQLWLEREKLSQLEWKAKKDKEEKEELNKLVRLILKLLIHYSLKKDFYLSTQGNNKQRV